MVIFFYIIYTFLDGFFKKSSCKIAMSGQVGIGWLALGFSTQVNLLVNFFTKLYVTFILQWIAFIFGRDEEENQ